MVKYANDDEITREILGILNTEAVEAGTMTTYFPEVWVAGVL